MRIIAGALKGRIFHDPPAHSAHPMSEKARGAIFNSLGDIDGLAVLDAFGGTGALAFEAISRGAKSAVIIEYKRATYKTILDSSKLLGISDQAKVVYADASSWSGHNRDHKFDIVLLDPPYDFLQMNILPRLTTHAKSGGLVIVSWPTQEEIPSFESCEQISNKKYGDAQLIFYRKT